MRPPPFVVTQAVKILLMGMAANTAGDAQRALSLSSPLLRKLEEEASLLASLRLLGGGAGLRLGLVAKSGKDKCGKGASHCQGPGAGPATACALPGAGARVPPPSPLPDCRPLASRRRPHPPCAVPASAGKAPQHRELHRHLPQPALHHHRVLLPRQPGRGGRTRVVCDPCTAARRAVK